MNWPFEPEALDLFEAMEFAEGESGREKEETEEMESVAGESRAAAKPGRKGRILYRCNSNKYN